MFAGMNASLDRQRRFLGTVVRDPLSVGALAPSSRQLAKLMVADMGPGSRVIELGAGTGSVTRAILDCGVAPCDLVVVEQSETFAGMLGERFPDVTVVAGDALSLNRHVANLAGPADFAVSGLPLLLFSPGRKLRLLTRVFAALRPEGALHQFTYGGRCPVERIVLRRLGLEASLMGFTPFNVPPAFVYRLQRS